MLQYEYLTPDEWEEHAPTKKVKPSPWDPILMELEQGKIVKLPLEGDQEVRGYRIGIARRARARGYAVEFRVVPGGLAFKQGKAHGKPARKTAPASAETTPPTKKRGWPRKVA
jgi:hypothetical protein